MKKSANLCLLTLAALALLPAAEARTSTVTFNKDAVGVEFWTGISEYTSNGASELEIMSTTWTNQLAIRSSDGVSVNLVLSGNYADTYPYPEGQASSEMNFLFEGANLVSLTVTSGGTLGLRTQTSAADFSTSTSCGSLQLNGASSLIVEGTGRVFANDLTMSNYTNLNKTVEIRDQAYFYTRGTARIGSAGASAVQTIRIVGSNIEQAYVRNLNFTGAEGTSAANPMGGKLEFIADENGITTLTNESAVFDFSGVVLVDFSNLIWDESWGSEYKFTLVSATGNSATAFEYFCNNQETLADVIGVGDWLFTYDNNNLYINISQVPEPATCAAIFGALALALAAYRRRK